MSGGLININASVRNTWKSQEISQELERGYPVHQVLTGQLPLSAFMFCELWCSAKQG